MSTLSVTAVDAVVMRDVQVHGEPRTLVKPVRKTSTVQLGIHSGAAAAFASLVAQPEVNHEEAQREALEEARKAGDARGYQEGLARAEKDALRQIREAVDAAVAKAQKPLIDKAQQMQSLLDGLSAVPQQCVEAAQDDIASLAFEVVCRILGERAATAEGIGALVAHTLSEWRGKQELAIHMHPDDVKLIESDSLTAEIIGRERQGRLKWVADSNVELGGCVINSDEGGLDARLEVQLGALKGLLLRNRRASQLPNPGDRA